MVLQAASIGKGGEVFVLDMGSPVRIADMAKELIYLCGKVPEVDANIEYVGLRPGEKLYEELLLSEVENPTKYNDIFIAKRTDFNFEILSENIAELLNYSKQGDKRNSLEVLGKIVKIYNNEEKNIFREITS